MKPISFLNDVVYRRYLEIALSFTALLLLREIGCFQSTYVI